MNFAHPGLLLIAAASIPLLGLFFAWSWRVRRRLIREFVPPRLQATLTLGLSPRRALARATLLVAAMAALLLALARPRLGAGSVEVKQRGLDIVLGVDTSRSMLAEDAGPGISRLQRARFAALDLARLAKRDRLGLIAFAGTAFLQCPLTVDDAAFRQSVDALDTGIIPQGGTSLSAAITTALEAFGSDRDNVRVLILFTDGEDHESGAMEAAARAAERGLRIFTVGVGSSRGEIVQLRDKDGNSTYLKDEQGNVVKSALNETLLQELASKTGGFYLPLQGARAMEELFNRGLEPLPRADIASRVMDQFHERFQWPLGLALILLIWEALLPERARTQGRTRAVRLDHPALGTPGTTVALALLAGLLPLLVALPRSAHASPASALREYQQGNFEEAFKEYERLAQSHPDDPRYRFNAGSSAYRAGNYTNAVQHFVGTLASPDLKLQHDSFYNLGNAQYRLGESAQDASIRQSSWEGAVKSFDAALKLDPKDDRSRQNLDFVRQRLEELKQQKQQNQEQQKQDQNKDQKKDDEKQQDKNQDKNEQSKNKDDSKESQDQNQDQNQDPGQSEKEKQEEQDKQDQNKDKDKDQQKSSGKDEKEKDSGQKPGEEKKDNGKESPDNKDQGKESQRDAGSEAQDAGDTAPPGQMTPKQAMRLLDTARGEEKMVPLEKRRARSRTVKDW
jgi:Ca-activated chloride channel family protein